MARWIVCEGRGGPRNATTEGGHFMAVTWWGDEGGSSSVSSVRIAVQQTLGEDHAFNGIYSDCW